ncbi:gram-negative bacteria-binding protein 3 [Drosophila hydei]|uniref:Gram-negative bacteria-binding protein 3 n=1 Tax=Drosophila hydei TaxID=7224 RepID=A0A6J1LNE6_DROHY|nr:gram-negative bacteria-binding protein 3 [Drosophila hydei]
MRAATSQVKQLILLFIVCGALGGSHAYDVPKVTVKVNSPKGFEVSVPDEQGISLFAFHGKLNAEMEDLSDQTWATDIVTARNGRWTYINRLQKLQPGDILYYWVTVRYNGLDYHAYNQSYQIHNCSPLTNDRITMTTSLPTTMEAINQ